MQKFQTLKGVKKGVDLMTVQSLLKMIQNSKRKVLLKCNLVEGRKELILRQLKWPQQCRVERWCETLQCTENRPNMNRPVSTLQTILRNIMYCCPYKISRVQELFPSKMPARDTFTLEFLARMKVDKEGPWKILWTDEAHFSSDSIC